MLNRRKFVLYLPREKEINTTHP